MNEDDKVKLPNWFHKAYSLSSLSCVDIIAERFLNWFGNKEYQKVDNFLHSVPEWEWPLTEHSCAVLIGILSFSRRTKQELSNYLTVYNFTKEFLECVIGKQRTEKCIASFRPVPNE